MQPIQSLISPDLLRKVAIFRKMTQSMRSRLSGELAPYCWVAEIKDSTLVVVTNQAERATHLRYQQHEILKQINEEFRAQLDRPLRRLHTKIDYALKVDEESQVPGGQVLSRLDIIGSAERQANKKHCSALLELLNTKPKQR